MQLHPDKDRSKVIETTLILSIALTLIAYFLKFKILFIASSILIIINFMAYKLSFWITQYWFNFAQVLGELMSRLILLLCFYLILTPVSLIYRIFNDDALDLQSGKDSYFHNREETFDKTYFERIW